MKNVMEKAVALYNVLVKKNEEFELKEEGIKELKVTLDGREDVIVKREIELDKREDSIKGVESCVKLLEEAKKLKGEAGIELTEAGKIKKEAELYIESEMLKIKEVQSVNEALKKNLESQQKSLNDEADRLRREYAM